jgi:hypothetical protein
MMVTGFRLYHCYVKHPILLLRCIAEPETKNDAKQLNRPDVLDRKEALCSYAERYSQNANKIKPVEVPRRTRV